MTVADKPDFREAFKNRRCLVPADVFHEWARTGKATQPFHFGMQDDSLFTFAGIWDQWKDSSGNPVETCPILTTRPNSLLAAVHDRMPVILERDDYELWLDPGFEDLNSLSEMLRPFNLDLMKSYPVSTRVNAPKNNDPECAAEIALVSQTERDGQLLPGVLLP